ncbi:MAG: hypothetical protein V3R82_03060 [Candidatus Hydrothermarchaeales archaeon]
MTERQNINRELYSAILTLFENYSSGLKFMDIDIIGIILIILFVIILVAWVYLQFKERIDRLIARIGGVRQVYRGAL